MRADAGREGAMERSASPDDRCPVRVWADDLTGALDTGAQFTGLLGPLPVLLQGELPAGGSAAWDNATRDKPWETARSGIPLIVDFLAPADLPYLKVDSLLRGHSLADLAATFTQGRYRRCILAPAFPMHGRVTRGGVQLRREPSGGWLPVAPALVDALLGLGVAARLAPTPDRIDGTGIIVCDAESDEHLARIARHGRQLIAAGDGPTLWSGSAGLAAALAGRPPPLLRPRAAPLLLVTGSAHAQSRAQLRAFADAGIAPVIEAAAMPSHGPRALARALDQDGLALFTFRPPDGSDTAEAMRFIRAQLAQSLPALDPPGALIVSGGETLRALCETLSTESLTVDGELRPGFPAARLVGGLWDGVPVISKSGAFGDTQCLIDLARMLMPDARHPSGDEP
jgi:uncharacterized protein YgbK (DUF1537 family)